MFPAALSQNGIGTSSLLISPRHMKEFRTYKSFLKEALHTKKNFLIVCFGGWHTSGSYAMYYLAAASPFTLAEIYKKFQEIGYSRDDIKLVQNIPKRSKVDIEKVVEIKLQKMAVAALNAIKKRREKKPLKKGMKRKRKR